MSGSSDSNNARGRTLSHYQSSNRGRENSDAFSGKSNTIIKAECIRTYMNPSNCLVNDVAYVGDGEKDDDSGSSNGNGHFSGKLDQFLTAGNDGRCRLFSMDTGECIRSFYENRGAVWSMSILRGAKGDDADCLLCGSVDGNVRLWHVSSGECLRTIRCRSNVRDIAPVTDVVDANFTTKNNKKLIIARTFLSTSYTGQCRWWNLSTGNCLLTIPRCTTDANGGISVSSVWKPMENSCRRKKSLLLVSGWVNSCTLRDLTAGGTLIRTFEGHTRTVSAVAFVKNEDGFSRSFLSGSGDGTCKLWDVHKGKCLITYRGHADLINCIEIVPGRADGEGKRTFVSASNDTTCRQWLIGTGRCIRIFEPHKYPVSAIRCVSSGKFLSVTIDGTVKLWRGGNWLVLGPVIVLRSLASEGHATMSLPPSESTREQRIEQELICNSNDNVFRYVISFLLL